MDLKITQEKSKILRPAAMKMDLNYFYSYWEGDNFRIPIGFALWSKDSNSINDLALASLSCIRNEFKLKSKYHVAIMNQY